MRGKVGTWVNSQWKYQATPGQFSVAINNAISKLSAQVVTTVNWNACMVAMHEDGCNVLLELLPGADLTRMLSEHPFGPKSRALSQFRSLEGAAAWLSRVTDVR